MNDVIFPVMGHIWRHVDTVAATLLHRCAQANAPAVWYYGCVMSMTTADAEIDKSLVSNVGLLLCRVDAARFQR